MKPAQAQDVAGGGIPPGDEWIITVARHTRKRGDTVFNQGALADQLFELGDRAALTRFEEGILGQAVDEKNGQVGRLTCNRGALGNLGWAEHDGRSDDQKYQHDELGSARGLLLRFHHQSPTPGTVSDVAALGGYLTNAPGKVKWCSLRGWQGATITEPMSASSIMTFWSSWRGLMLIVLVGLSWSLRATSPLEPTIIDDASYHESFTVVADLDDSTYIMVQFGFSNLGSGDGHGACRALVIEKGKAPWTKVARHDRDEWRFATEPVAQLSIGACRVWQGSSLEIHAPIEDSVVRLSLRTKLRATHPPGSEIAVGDSFYQYTVLAGLVAVRAEWSLDGAEGKSAEGYAYADKLRSTAMPKDVAQYWIRYRALEKDGMISVGRIPAEGGTGELWSWQPGSEPAPSSGKSVVIERVGKDANEFAITLTLADGKVLKLHSGQEMSRYAPVEQIGWLKFFAKAVVGSPVTRTFRPKLLEGSTLVHGRAVLEVSYVD